MRADALATDAAESRGPKAHELRALASPEAPRLSTWVGVALAAADYLVFYTGAAVFVVAPWWPVKAAGVLVSGVAVATLFALAHDAAHGSLAASRAMNRVLATLCFLPSWYPYTPWIRGHNHLHHGWTNVAECDYSWRPVSPQRVSGDARVAARPSSRCIGPGGGSGRIRSWRSGGSTWRCPEPAIVNTSTPGTSWPTGSSLPPSSPRTSRRAGGWPRSGRRGPVDQPCRRR